MKVHIAKLLVLVLILSLFSGCSMGKPSLNGTPVSEFVIVYSTSAPDYCQRAAAYIQSEILARTGIQLTVCEESEGTYAHEIVVGETNRPISAALDADTQNVEFAILADQNHIALEGDYFIIAAAAYFFVETYIPGKRFQSNTPQEVTIHKPITEKTKNVIFLIGDGMGFNHTKLFEKLDVSTSDVASDGESIFYGYYLPYQGKSHTDSLSGTTDSAASATALATGYKTINYYVGKDQDLNDLTSLTELAGSQGKATAVMSTETMTGATPAGFSAHANDRNDSDDILACQAQMMKTYGTIFDCDLHCTDLYQDHINDTLTKLSANENGFFLMYEEAYIDKFSHNNDLPEVFNCVVRFNQAIGVFMEYAFYNPDTMVIITADHETGGLMFVGDDKHPDFFSTGHTSANVPVFAYGYDAAYFQGFDTENVYIPKYIASLWGVNDFGQ